MVVHGCGTPELKRRRYQSRAADGLDDLRNGGAIA
jgi:hypothetical protein